MLIFVAHLTIFWEIDFSAFKHTYILCIFLVDIHRRNYQLFVSPRFNNLNVTGL